LENNETGSIRVCRDWERRFYGLDGHDALNKNKKNYTFVVRRNACIF